MILAKLLLVPNLSLFRFQIHSLNHHKPHQSNSLNKLLLSKCQLCRLRLNSNKWLLIWLYNNSKCSKHCKQNKRTNIWDKVSLRTTLISNLKFSNWPQSKPRTWSNNDLSPWLQLHHKFKLSTRWPRPKNRLQFLNKLMLLNKPLCKLTHRDFHNKKQTWKLNKMNLQIIQFWGPRLGQKTSPRPNRRRGRLSMSK